MGALRSRARMNAATISAVNGATPPQVSDLASAASSKGISLISSKSSTLIHEERLHKIFEMIESGKPCTIQGLAEQLNLSHSRLQHLFKQQTGMSLGHLLTQQRLHRAADLLIHSNKRIKEIAHAVGYEHASSFIRAFERHFAKAPRLFRRSQNGNND